jgi:1-phosphofructokinase family hexose kinase
MIYTLTLNPAVDRELTVPELAFDHVLRATAWQVDFGGKGFNVSRLLSSLGQDSIAVGFAGGRAGELLRDGLHSLGIATDFIWVAGETRTNVSIVNQDHSHYLKANEPGPAISSESLDELVKKVGSLAGPGDWWVLAGSLPPGVPDSIYAGLIAIIQDQGAKVILDTSGESLALGCQAKPFLVKPNAYEAATLTGLPVENKDQIALAGQAVRSAGPANVVISLGKDGAMLLTGAGSWTAKAPEIEERNPIGAGDSMVGGLVWGLHAGLELECALAWGIACGAATASLSGTAVGSRALVETLLAQVQVVPL